jgi:hypothetical protein
MSAGGPQRRVTDHWHPEYWTEQEQHRFEDKLTREMEAFRLELKGLANRLTLMLGALALLGFLLPIVAPFLRDFLSIP